MQPAALRMARNLLNRWANTRGRRMSQNLRDRARVYLKAFEWRNSLISSSPSVFHCHVCEQENIPIGRCMFFIQNYTNENASPNACPHLLCSDCHYDVWVQEPLLDELSGIRPVVSKIRTHCLWCRQPGRYL